jgi:hypothetical protein
LSHPSDIELNAFLGRTLSGSALVDWDGHLAVCGACRLRLESQARLEVSEAWLRREIGQVPRQEHLSEDAVRTLAEGRALPAAESHMRSCAPCRAEVADLRSFIAAQKPPGRRGVRWYALAAAVLAAAFLPFGWHLWQQRPALPAEYRALLEQATRTGRLGVPTEFAALNRKAELLLGPPAKTKSFALRQPLGEAVLSGQPSFIWDQMAGASTYRVAVYDEQFQKVLESPDIPITQWRPDQTLAGNHTYSWTVTAQTNGDRVRAPVPPAPEAKFAVLADADIGRLQEARRLYPSQHLLLAVLFARAGVLAEARKELAADGSELAGKLAASLP